MRKTIFRLTLVLAWVGTVLPLLTAAEGGTHTESKKPAPPSSSSGIAPDQTAPPGTDPAGEFIVHEWGTFTTFSGSDGVFLEFRPLANQVSDLPNFVLDRSYRSPTGLFSKIKLRGRVRMETPVTYFYTDRIRDVKVSVGFPKGLLTEFYPPVREMLPKFDASVAYKEGEPIGNSQLDWGTVTLIPTTALVPGIEDATLRAQVAEHVARTVLPRGANDNHYTQARATDSALVHVRASLAPWVNGTKPKDDAAAKRVPPGLSIAWPVNPPGSSLRLDGGRRSFLEKFLFYRGVGDFDLPFAVDFGSSEEAVFHNQSSLPMNSAILVDVDGKHISMAKLSQLAPGKAAAFDKPQPTSLEALSEAVVDALVEEGLYEKEAKAMVETWKQSWFTEQGTRILYMVPETITDELLPLKIEPRPQQSLRVLVGRMEVMSPETEKAMLEAVVLTGVERSKHRARVKGKPNQNHFPFPQRIREFGRLAEPALVRISKIAPMPEIRDEAERLIAELRRG